MLMLVAVDPDPEQVQHIKDAGYKTDQLAGAQAWQAPMGSKLVMAIIGSGESFEGFLSPPMCPWCHKMMGVEEEESKLVFLCPNCGGKEEHIRTPPGGRDDIV